MDNSLTISKLKTLLLQDIETLCCRQENSWNQPIVDILQKIHQDAPQAVFLGGTLRSLLISRLQAQQLGRPRDIDIVVADANMGTLRNRFRSIITRETRFGGLQLKHMGWQFDVWPLDSTWAFIQDKQQNPMFSMLPQTTFFNLEAIAVDIWKTQGQPRNIYSENDIFFKGILSRTLEINREDNPFPALCVVRAFVMSTTTQFSIGPRLAHYLAIHSSNISDIELEHIQEEHYGRILSHASTIRDWLDHLCAYVS